MVSTDEAAYYLNRKPQTLRVWSTYPERGVLRPLRVNGRLAWPVAEIRKLLGVVVIPSPIAPERPRISKQRLQKGGFVWLCSGQGIDGWGGSPRLAMEAWRAHCAAGKTEEKSDGV